MAGYGSDSGLTAYATAAGYTLPVGDNLAAARERGSSYIDGTYGLRFSGVPAGGIDQERAWPRSGATDVYGNAIAPDAIPQRVINASYEAAYLELKKPGSLSVTVDPSARVRSQKVDVIEREFFEPKERSVWAPDAPTNSKIDGILAPLLGPARPLPAVLVV